MALSVFVLQGCGRRAEPLQVNAPLLSPYPAIWAVAPLANESGVSVFDPMRISDILTEEIARVQGLEAIPVQRVLVAMRALDIGAVESPAQARAIANVLGVDGLIVGSITAYDPYRPPKLGLTLQLYAADQSVDAAGDMRALRSAPGDDLDDHGFLAQDAPSAGVSAVVDAADNGVLLAVERFAKGRTDRNTAYAWERYLVVMELYSQFVCHRLLGDLLYQERLRSVRAAGERRQRIAPAI